MPKPGSHPPDAKSLTNWMSSTLIPYDVVLGFATMLRPARGDHLPSNIQPRSPLWFQEELEKAADLGWILSSSDVEALIGVKPKGEIFQRGGWEFTRAGKIGNQGAWKVNKLNSN